MKKKKDQEAWTRSSVLSVCLQIPKISESNSPGNLVFLGLELHKPANFNFI